MSPSTHTPGPSRWLNAVPASLKVLKRSWLTKSTHSPTFGFTPETTGHQISWFQINVSIRGKWSSSQLDRWLQGSEQSAASAAWRRSAPSAMLSLGSLGLSLGPKLESQELEHKDRQKILNPFYEQKQWILSMLS